ncbi:hypothetical protein LQ757_11515 [Agromyces sp. SYSU K20354]|uniref:hypothetical protein n=1 Tax=Agromyces cavernae TaxID=2898659 RepID=UPI001E409A19|nr:hypothetical protein [Agromyces cavernae]MCD2442899.1 hypothetical protein [Agromyces cavernae]
MSASTRHSGARRLLATGIAVGLAATALLAAPATAKPLEHSSFSEEFFESIDDFCDVPGLTIDREATAEGKILFNARKPGTAPYFHLVASSEARYSNAEGDFVTEKVNIVEKDLKITDNGDGTLTILVLVTGNATTFGPDGKAIARNPGQVRFEVLIDHNGTVDDPSDDVFLADLGLVKGSTGRSDDFCAAVVPILG